MNRIFRVGVIGAGRIAATIDTASGPAIRTHMKAISAEPRLAVTHIGDLDSARASQAASLYGINAEILSPDAVAVADIDALCIASPDGTHMNYVERAISGLARVVVVEKPLEGERSRRENAVVALAARGASLVVNHQRRWIPGLSDWISNARRGSFGRPLSGTINYTRGFRHNCVHALDIVSAFADVQVMKVERIASDIVDYSDEDPTRSLLVTLGSALGSFPLAIFGVDGRVQTVFSVQLRFERASISMYDEDGVRAELSKPVDVNYPGYAPELRPVTRFLDDPPQLFFEVWRNIADHLESGSPIACAGENALGAYDLADSILAGCDA